MSMRRNTMANGRTGFWMHVGHNLNVRVINGTMYKLLNAKKGFTLTHILSPHIGHQIVRALLYRNERWVLMESPSRQRGRFYGLYGLKARYTGQGWGLNTKSQKFRARKAQADMSQNTSSSQPFSQLVGLRDGSAYATLKSFHQRRNGRLTQ